MYANATAANAANSTSMLDQAVALANQYPKTAMALGGATGILALMKANAFKPNYMPTYQPPSAASYGLGRTMSPQYQPTFAAKKGGIASLAVGGTAGQQYPMSQINYDGYNTPTQMPTTALNMAGYQPSNMPLQGALTQNMASGGISAAGESTGPLQIYQPQSSSGTTLQSLASEYGINLPTTTAAEGGIMSLASGGDTTAPASSDPLLAQLYSQQQSNEIDPKTGVPYSQEQLNGSGGFLGSITNDLSSIGNSIGNGVSSLGRSLGLASGGATGTYNLGGYSDGGRLLKGPGDGMSDHIPASIADKQPARLADGEFVVPADVVSHLGNGSTDAGARHLYSMMDRVRKARTGSTKQGKQIQPEKYMPA
jgi:hypothetical protein